MTAQEFCEEIAVFPKTDLRFRLLDPDVIKYEILQVHSFELVSINGTATIQIDFIPIDLQV
jgi:hypothetical protein